MPGESQALAFIRQALEAPLCLPGGGGQLCALHSHFDGVVTNFCDASLASCPVKEYDDVFEEVNSVVAFGRSLQSHFDLRTNGCLQRSSHSVARRNIIRQSRIELSWRRCSSNSIWVIKPFLEWYEIE